MTTTTVLAFAAAAGTVVGTTAGAVLAAWAWSRASGETRRCPDPSHTHFARRNR